MEFIELIKSVPHFYLQIFMVIFFILGILELLFPSMMIRFRFILIFKDIQDMEPTDYAKITTRIGGFLLLAISITIFIVINNYI